MFPPIEDAVLKNNPDFANLYSTLTTAILNPNGSTKQDPAAKERDAVREELKKHRIQAAKRHLLSHAIATTVPPPERRPPRQARSRPQSVPASDLPEPLLDLLILLPPLLSKSNPLPPDSVAILLSTPPLADLPTLLPQLGPLVSSSLQTSAANLAKITSPNTNPSFLHRQIPSLPHNVSTLTSQIEASKTQLVKARQEVASSLAGLLQAQAQVLTLLIRSLEAKHGVVARSLELRAAEVALVAQRAEVEAQIAKENVFKEVYNPEVSTALRNYGAHLKDARRGLEGSIDGLRDALAQYGVHVGDGKDAGKERTMTEMARVYREMGRQMDDVRGDLERLGRS